MCKGLDGGKQGPRPGMGDEHDEREPGIETGGPVRKGRRNRGRGVAVLVVLRSHSSTLRAPLGQQLMAGIGWRVWGIVCSVSRSSEHDFTGCGVLRLVEQR